VPLAARLLYAGAATLAAPGLRLMLRWRLTRGKEIAGRLAERRGVDPTPRPPGRLLWLHAASVGEAASLLPVLQELAGLAPTLTVLLTTGTVTSAALLAHRLPEVGLDQRVLHRFVPLDVPAWAERFLAHWQPDAAGFLESEIWPNLLGACRRHGVKLMLVNARLSARSAARWRRLPGVARALFGGFCHVQAQSEADARRLAALGAPPAVVVGNLKFAAAPLPVAEAELDRLRALLRDRPVWLAASTHRGEEVVVAEVHADLAARHPRLLTIVVPRHPGRGAEIEAAFRDVAVARRAAGADPPAASGVWIADTLGELGLFYRLAGIAFVGGSLVAHGGQNPLEPARLGCAVAVGPHAGNFADVVAVLEAAGALVRVADAAGLAAWVGTLLRDPARRQAMGEAGERAANGGGELPRRVAELLLGLVEGEGLCPLDPHQRRSLWNPLVSGFQGPRAFGGPRAEPWPSCFRAPTFWTQRAGMASRLLSPIATVYAASTARRVARPGWRAPVPVICCGNAGVGGAGKTPLALDLGARLAAHGVAVAFLTRGYGARVRSPVRVDPARHDAATVGDEALLLAACAPTFVCPDRAEAARLALAGGARVLLMDDGLQNPSLLKDLSLLVIDGAVGFGNGRVIPAGPLREPVAAAARRCRAAVLIGADANGARAELPPDLPVLTAHATPEAEAAALAGQRVLAFAGIGRPEKFFAMLREAGIAVASCRGFADHHRYSEPELRRLLTEADRLGALPVTTPKDAVRLPAPLRTSVRVVGMRLVWSDPSAIEALLAEVRCLA
jgi:3-deoxy-D-manno-octulosonic-acid transferase